MANDKNDKFITELIRRSEKFISDVEIWEDYPRDPSYFAISSFLRDVLIPSLQILKKGDKNE